MFFPNAGVEINLAWLLSLGLTVGILSGFFGVGGGFLVTGGLIVFGVPPTFAVGTGLTFIMGSSLINTLKHRKLGNVDVRLGLFMIVGTIPGVELAKRVLLQLEASGNEGPTVRYVYVVVLAILGLFLVYDFLRSKKERTDSSDRIFTGALVDCVRRVPFPPRVSLPVSGIPDISLWVLVAIGFAVGFFAGLLGAGGGFLLMPVLVYVVGVPTVTAVGTDLFQIVVTGSFGTLTYALADRVDLIMALIMLGAASLGSQLGTMATRVVDGSRLRMLYGLTMLAGSVAIALEQASTTSESLEFLSTIGAIVLLGFAGLICAVIAAVTLGSLLRTRNQVPLERGQPG